MSVPDLEFVYVGDPMCSWCWGFAPVLEQLQERYAIGLRTMVGGLRPGPSAESNTPRLRAFLREHWEHVAQASGQPFDMTLLERFGDGWRYDTEPGCRSVVAMRQVAPGREFAWFKRLQHAFYADGVDIVDVDRHLDLLDGFAGTDDAPIDADKFAAVLTAEETRRETAEEFRTVHGWGITGFPTLLLREDDQLMPVTRGWIAYDHLERQLSRWIEKRFPEQVDGLICEVGGPC